MHSYSYYFEWIFLHFLNHQVSCHQMNITPTSITRCTQTQPPNSGRDSSVSKFCPGRPASQIVPRLLVCSLLWSWQSSSSILSRKSGKKWPNASRSLLTRSPVTTPSLMATLKVHVLSSLTPSCSGNSGFQMTSGHLCLSHRSARETGRHCDAGLSSGPADVCRGQEEWSRGVWVYNRPQRSRYDMGRQNTDWKTAINWKKSFVAQIVWPLILCSNESEVSGHTF